MQWTISTWPEGTVERWDEIETLEAASFAAVVKRLMEHEPGRYLIANVESLGHGQFIRLEADGTTVHVETF
jgi:hypothetical protein